MLNEVAVLLYVMFWDKSVGFFTSKVTLLPVVHSPLMNDWSNSSDWYVLMWMSLN